MKKIINQMISGVFGHKSHIVQSLLLPSIGFKLKTKDRNSVSVRSKFGGYPNVPNDFNWPKHDEKPLSFLCQICLDEISKYDSSLPKKGILYFFILTEIDSWRFPENEFKVIYIEEYNQDYIENKNNSAVFVENAISFFEHYSFPSYQEYIMLKNNFSDEDIEDIEEIYRNICEITGQTEDCGHQILGHPNALQGAVRYFWAKHPNTDRSLTNIQIEEFGNEGQNFINLLQIDFNDPLINYDKLAAVAYFGLHKNDLLEKKIDNVKLVMQNS